MTRSLLLLALSLLLGCAGPGEPARITDGEGPIASLLAPGPPWAAEGDEPRWLRAEQRAVLAELGVELVDEKWRLPGPLTWNPLMLTPFPSMLGISVRQAVYPPHVQEVLPVRLTALLVQELDARGIVWVPLPRPARALQAPGVTRSECIRAEHLPMAEDPFKDVGLTRRITALAAPGTYLLEGDPDVLRTADRALLVESGADVVLHVRLRAGVSEGRAALEAGSRIDWTTADAQGTLVARRSLLGEAEVVDYSSFALLRGFEEVVDALAFVSEVEGLVPRYLGLALEAIR